MTLWAAGPQRADAIQDVCPSFNLADPGIALESIAVVLIADVTGATDSTATLAPIAYLKGAASGATLLLTARDDGCEQATFGKGSRVLVILAAQDGRLVWPVPDHLFEIDASVELDQDPIVAQFRDLTGQLAFPAETDAAGAGIRWGSVILPVGMALIIVFGVSFILMIFWHRIDPS